MSTYYNNIQADIKAAMIAKETVKRDCLRSVISEIKNQTINAGKEITDDICLSVLRKFVKTHEDSIAQFTTANRMDLVEKEQAELNYLKKYLPQMLDELQTAAYITEVIKANSIELVKKNMGQLMKLISSNSSVDRKIASKYLNTILK